MAEELRLDEARRKRGKIERQECRVSLVEESRVFFVEGDVATLANGARNELFSGARRANDEGVHLVHAIVQGALVAPHVVGEHRFPDRSAQIGCRLRSAHDAQEDHLESASELKAQSKQVCLVLDTLGRLAVKPTVL